MVDYSADQQAEVGRSIRKRLVSQEPRATDGRQPGSGGLPAVRELAGWAGGILLVAALGWAAARWVRRLWRRRSSTAEQEPDRTPFAFEPYARILALVEQRFQLRPRPDETPREFALAAEGALRLHPDAAPLARLSLEVVSLLYRVRYGDEPLNRDEWVEMDHRIREMENALAPRAPQGDVG